jgi:cytochrome c oxidase cbb3-type subunit I/II
MSAQHGNDGPEHPHRRLERRLGLFAILTTVAISIGGIAEITPMFSARLGPQPLPGVTPYTPLEVAGRDIYIREGCYVCHSQMVRPMRAELQRYGEWTRAGEYAYDRPFQLGSRRTGPDLQRVGGKYPDAWHYEHMRDPRSTSPGSIMPRYPWLYRQRYTQDDVFASVRAMQKLGVPYVDADYENVATVTRGQAQAIVGSLAGMQIASEPDLEIIALIAYLQRLGKDGKRVLAATPEPAAPASPGEAGTPPANAPAPAAAPTPAPAGASAEPLPAPTGIGLPRPGGTP